MSQSTKIPEGDALVFQLLWEAGKLLTRHPRVTRAVVSAFVAEGRAFAETADGQRLREQLMASPEVRRARLLWDSFGLDRFAHPRAGFSPSWWLRMLRVTTASPRLEELLSRIFLVEEMNRG
jgi:hypothetical protein